VGGVFNIINPIGDKMISCTVISNLTVVLYKMTQRNKEDVELKTNLT